MNSNKYPWIIFLIVIAVLLFNTPRVKNFPKNVYSALPITTVSFAGLDFQDSGTLINTGSCNSGGGQTFISGGADSPLTISASASSQGATRTLRADITGIDELLIVYEGVGSCQPQQAGGGISARLIGSDSGDLAVSKGIPSSNNNCGLSGTESDSFQRAIWKFKNNFDGTWSLSEGLAIGDLDLKVTKHQISGRRQYLELSVSATSACALGGSASSSLTLYNIIQKENGFSLCRGDQYLLGLNGTKPICKNSSYLALNFEESLHQYLSDYFASKESYLDQKSRSLNLSIDDLRRQLQQASQDAKSSLEQQIYNLSLEQQETKRLLQAIQNKNISVVSTFVQSDIQAQKPQPAEPETNNLSFDKLLSYSLTKVILGMVALIVVLRLL